jgi:hypothetical protein
LARATARRLKLIKRLACRTTRPHSTLRGLDQLHRLDATLDGFDYTHNLLWRVNYFFSYPPFGGGFAPFI